MPDTNPTPDNLRAARLAAGLSQPALAKLMGVAVMTVCYWETAQADIKSRDLRLFAEVCGVNAGGLLYELEET